MPDDSRAVGPLDTTVASDTPQAEAGEQTVRALLDRALGHYKVETFLGRGGMGAVYRAWDTSLERPVAVKVLLHDSPQAKARFLREARAQAQLRHPNVVPIHFVGEAEGTAFFAMEIVEGETLASLLAREGVLAPARAIDIVDAVASALDAGCDRGLVHRDVKPSNILLDSRGRVLLADFGLAKAVAESEAAAGSARPSAHADDASSAAVALTRAGVIVGTPAYVAPEQAAAGAVDHRADIYSLGVTLYEMLTGQPPFTGETAAALLRQHQHEEPLPPRMLVPHLAPGLNDVVLRMMQKRPDARFATYEALREALEAARGGPVAPASVTTRASAWLIDFFAFVSVGGIVALIASPLLPATFVLLATFCESRWGQTPGKWLLKIRTVGPDGMPARRARSFVRACVKYWGMLASAAVAPFAAGVPALQVAQVLIFTSWLASYALVLFGARLTLHDRAGDTRAVYAIDFRAHEAPRLGSVSAGATPRPPSQPPAKP